MRFPEMRDIDRAVSSAFELVRDFAGSDIGKRLSPTQLISVIAIASAEEADHLGMPRQFTTAKLREVADALDHGCLPAPANIPIRAPGAPSGPFRCQD